MSSRPGSQPDSDPTAKTGADLTPRWRKSSLSGTGNCVEVAVEGGRVLVRDSEDPTGPRLNFTAAQWDCFIAGVRAGEFDRQTL